MTAVRRLGAAVVTALLVGAAAVTGAPASAVEADPAEVVVEDAQLRWAVNDESNNRAFAPGTVNFLSAGAVPDPGAGGSRIVGGLWQGTSTTAWRAAAGDVRVEKRLDGTWRPATFAGLSTTTTGATMVGTNGPFSAHQVVLDGGRGVVDTEAGTAEISWTGSFSVVFYSGMTFFTVTDPALVVGAEGARLTGELSGYASSMEDQTVWRPVPPARVTLADLPRPDLTSGDGFTVEPRYRGVLHRAPADGTEQVRSGASWGSFPQSFVDYQHRLGGASYWYSSGGSADPHKVAAPVTVSLRADRPVDVPPTGGSGTPATPDQPRTELRPEPPAPGTTSPSASAAAGGQDPASGGTGDGDADAPVAGVGPQGLVTGATSPGPTTSGGTAAPVSTDVVHALSASPASAGATGSDHRWTWWLGSVLLLLAAATTVHAVHTSRTSSPKGPR